MIAQNIAAIKAEIRSALANAGRTDNVMLVAATKTRTAEEIQAAIAGGVDATAENRIQEFVEKHPQGAYIGKPSHFIGHIQTNKLKHIVGKVDLIESVDSLRLAGEINKICVKEGITQDILLEINIGGEEAKHGFSPAEFADILPAVATLPAIRVRGLMTVAPIVAEKAETLQFMRKMQEIYIDTAHKNYDNIKMEYLSMGMSGDFREAIACGANIVRIGTAIFGARDYH